MNHLIQMSGTALYDTEDSYNHLNLQTIHDNNKSRLKPKPSSLIHNHRANTLYLSTVL